MMRLKWISLAALGLAAVSLHIVPAQAQAPKKPNILIIWGDDIGQFNISAYNLGMMGYKTPNIDSIAKEGALFTDWYGQQSCTAGRAAFITGQSPIRTGLTKVGLPGAPEGLKKEDPTHRRAAQAARLRDRPVRQEPSRRPQRHAADGSWLRRILRQSLPPERRGGAGERRLSRRIRRSRQKFGPRGVIHCFATDKDDPTTIRASARSASRSAKTPVR